MAERYLHQDDRLLPRFRRGGGLSPAARPSEPVYSTRSYGTLDPTDRDMIGRLPTFGLDGTIWGTQPEEALLRKHDDDDD